MSQNAEFCEFKNGVTSIQINILHILLHSSPIFSLISIRHVWLCLEVKRVVISFKVLRHLIKCRRPIRTFDEYSWDFCLTCLADVFYPL